MTDAMATRVAANAKTLLLKKKQLDQKLSTTRETVMLLQKFCGLKCKFMRPCMISKKWVRLKCGTTKQDTAEDQTEPSKTPISQNTPIKNTLRLNAKLSARKTTVARLSN